MKALICGAGIAGLTLATQLGRQGWDVTLIDAAAAARDAGYMVNLFGSGYGAADRMGLMPLLQDLGYDFDAFEWRNPAGEPTARIPYPTIRQMLEERLLSLVRGDLEKLLISTLPESVNLRFECSVTQVRTPVGAVEAVLGTGEVERGDVLVGADGLDSRVRGLVFGDGGSLWFRFMGFHTAAFVFPAAELNGTLGQNVRIVSAPGRQVGFYPLRNAKVAVVFAHRAPNGAPPLSASEALRSAYGDLKGPVANALEASETLPNLHYEQVGQVVISQWCRGRIALLGDACQAVSLLPGQGASLSMAAAYVLADELCGGAPVNQALSAYERRVRPQMTLMRRSARRAADWLIPATPAGLMARNGTIRLANLPGLTRLFRPAAGAASENVLSM